MKKISIIAALLSASCAAGPQYDVVIRHGTVYDGSGSPGVVEDLAIQGDRIAALGALGGSRSRQEVDASGLAVAPGFIDMLNHSETSLTADGRSQSGIRQG
jgi:N-acyl-D-amino-acid deacylase